MLSGVGGYLELCLADHNDVWSGTRHFGGLRLKSFAKNACATLGTRDWGIGFSISQCISQMRVALTGAINRPLIARRPKITNFAR